MHHHCRGLTCIPLNSIVAFTGCGFHVVDAPSSLHPYQRQSRARAQRIENVPIQHDDTIPAPIGRRNPTSDVCADHERPVKGASDAHTDALPPRSPAVPRKDGLGRLCHCVEFLVDTPGTIAVDMNDTAASTAAAIRPGELGTASAIERKIPHEPCGGPIADTANEARRLRSIARTNVS